MKRLPLLFTILFFFLWFAASCEKVSVDNKDRYQLPLVEDETTFFVEERIRSCDVYKNFLYFCYDGMSGLYTLNITTGEIQIFAAEIPEPILVATDFGGIYVLDQSAYEILSFDFAGSLLSRQSLPEEGEYWDFDHYDGLFAVTGRGGTWSIADGEKNWKKVELNYIFTGILRIRIRDRKRLLLHVQNMTESSVSSAIIECDRKGRSTRILVNESTQAFDINEGCLFMANGLHRVFEVTEAGNRYVMTPEVPDEYPLVSKIIVSGRTMLVFSGWQKYIRLYPMPSDSDTVKIVLPSSEASFLRNALEIVSSVTIQYDILDDETFFTKLTTKLMANESDFDVALVSGDPSNIAAFFPPLVMNDLFIDLYGGAALKENLDEMYSGARKMVELEGKMYALPLGFTEAFYGFFPNGSTISAPDLDWNADSLWKLCEEARKSHRYVFDSTWGVSPEELLEEMILSTISSKLNAATGKMEVGLFNENTRQIVVDITDILNHYRENRDILFGENALVRKIGEGIFYPQHLYPLKDFDKVLLLPSANQADSQWEGKGHIQGIPGLKINQNSARNAYGLQSVNMTSALFINPNAENLNAAYAFLTELTNEENRYNGSLYKSPLFPDLTKYFINNDDPDHFGQKRPRSIFMDYNSAYLTALDPIMNDYYEASTVNLFVVTDRAKEAIADFVKGTLSVEDAAEILYQELVYTLKG